MNLQYIKFHLVNFRNFEGISISSIEQTRINSWSGRAVILAGGWKVIIDKLHSTGKDAEKKLASCGGYFITHVGKIEKTDNTEFTAEQVENLLNSLHYFFSFSRGIWSGPILPVGFDANDNKVWEKWEAPNIDSWKNVRSWFNLDHHSLADLFPGFWKKWQNPVWQNPIQLAVHWYVESCKKVVAIEGSLVLQQVALEMLSWVEIVDNRQSIPEDDFENTRIFPAYKKIEELLKLYNIPVGLPTTLANLHQLYRNNNLSNGPHVITWIRNGVTHGNSRNRQKILNLSTEAKLEAWELGKWYLELVLLRLFDYEGYHSNWTKSGGTKELVPWKNP